MRNPEFFRGASPEHARIAPDQLLILMDHVRCAAFELPFSADESFGKENLVEMLTYLEEQGVLHREGERWHWIADSYPANSVSLRSVADGNFVVIDITAGKKEVIAEVDYSSAALTLYEGAIYLIQACSVAGREARLEGPQGVRHADAGRLLHRGDRLSPKLKILDRVRARRFRVQPLRPRRSACRAAGRGLQEDPLLHPRERGLRQGQSAGPRDAYELACGGRSIQTPCPERSRSGRTRSMDSSERPTRCTRWQRSSRCRNAMTSGARWEVATAPGSRSPILTGGESCSRLLETKAGSVGRKNSPRPCFLYDNYPGGIGLSVPLFDLRREVVTRAASLISACACKRGCPACVGPVLASEEDREMSLKAAASAILALLRWAPIEMDLRARLALVAAEDRSAERQLVSPNNDESGAPLSMRLRRLFGDQTESEPRVASSMGELARLLHGEPLADGVDCHRGLRAALAVARTSALQRHRANLAPVPRGW